MEQAAFLRDLIMWQGPLLSAPSVNVSVYSLPPRFLRVVSMFVVVVVSPRLQVASTNHGLLELAVVELTVYVETTTTTATKQSDSDIFCALRVKTKPTNPYASMKCSFERHVQCLTAEERRAAIVDRRKPYHPLPLRHPPPPHSAHCIRGMRTRCLAWCAPDPSV